MKYVFSFLWLLFFCPLNYFAISQDNYVFLLGGNSVMLFFAAALYFFYFSNSKQSGFKAQSCLFGLISFGGIAFALNHLTYEKMLASTSTCEGQRRCLYSLVISLGPNYYWIILVLFIVVSVFMAFISYSFWPKKTHE